MWCSWEKIWAGCVDLDLKNSFWQFKFHTKDYSGNYKNGEKLVEGESSARRITYQEEKWGRGLEKRNQIGGEKSGVQGSVLAPVIFIIYRHDMAMGMISY